MKKQDGKNKSRSKLAKKISRQTFIECDTRTRVLVDKTIYNRKKLPKVKH